MLYSGVISIALCVIISSAFVSSRSMKMKRETGSLASILETQILSFPPESFASDKPLRQQVDKANGISTYKQDGDDEPIYERQEADTDKNVIVLTEEEDKITNKNSKKIFVVLKKSAGNMYLPSLAIIKDASPTEKNAVMIEGKSHTIEWLPWDDHIVPERSLSGLKMVICTTSVLIPCLFNTKELGPNLIQSPPYKPKEVSRAAIDEVENTPFVIADGSDPNDIYGYFYDLENHRIEGRGVGSAIVDVGHGLVNNGIIPGILKGISGGLCIGLAIIGMCGNGEQSKMAKDEVVEYVDENGNPIDPVIAEKMQSGMDFSYGRNPYAPVGPNGPNSYLMGPFDPVAPPGQNPYAQGPPGQNPYSQGPPGQNPYSQGPPGQNPYSQGPPGQNPSPYGQNPPSPYGQVPGQNPSPYGQVPGQVPGQNPTPYGQTGAPNPYGSGAPPPFTPQGRSMSFGPPQGQPQYGYGGYGRRKRSAQSSANFPGWKTQFIKATKGSTFHHEQTVIFHGFGNCPLHNKSKSMGDNNDDIIHYYLTALRTDCISRSKGIIDSLLTVGILAKSVHKEFEVVSTHKYATQGKLIMAELISLTEAVEFASFTHAYQKHKGKGKSPEKVKSPSGAIISKSAAFVGDILKIYLNMAHTKAPVHCIYLARNMFLTLNNIMSKISQDTQNLEACGDCSEDKTVNQNDLVYVTGLQQFLKRGIGPVLKGAAYDDTINKFFKDNHDKFENLVKAQA